METARSDSTKKNYSNDSNEIETEHSAKYAAHNV
jgi:hypothetical protein